MTRGEFQTLVKNGPVILDGATGTNLQRAGMPVGVCPEQWILENPEVIVDLQGRYVEAGTGILYAPTFTANRIKLGEYGLERRLVPMNGELIALSKEAAAGKAFVAGDMTMTGQQLYPIGEMLFEELVEVYREQAAALYEAGADLFVVETMMSLQECRAAVLAIREVCNLPIMVSLTYNENGRTLYGTDPVTAAVTLQELGADAVGLNCSTGPEAMLAPVAHMAEYATVPILAKPNAGMPMLVDGVTTYHMGPEEFAAVGAKLADAGAAILGGCCGTTPEHIAALARAVAGKRVREPLKRKRRVLTSERKSVEIRLDGNFMVIGERINPTGKKKLQAEIKAGSLDLVRQMAAAQEEAGAAILDINMGMNGIDEKERMIAAVYEVTSTVDCPLCIDSSHVDVIEAALRIYPGRALINSISMEKEKLKRLLPIAEKYGAMFILLPLSDAGLPKDSAEKHGIIRAVMEEAKRAGLDEEDIIVDGLVATVGANPKAALECLETFAYCRDELGLPTACGLSNISFGLPERSYVNAAFLAMAIAKGLTMAIANPSQDLLMNAAFASDMLLDREDGSIRYIEHMNAFSERNAAGEGGRSLPFDRPAGRAASLGGAAASLGRAASPGGAADSFGHSAVEGSCAADSPGGTPSSFHRAVDTSRIAEAEGGNAAAAPCHALAVGDGRLPRDGGRVPGGSEGAAGTGGTGGTGAAAAKTPVYVAVLKGNKGKVLEETEKLLASGWKPDEIINGQLIPAINEVGELFDRQKYFLPQLISSANTMELAIKRLEPLLEQEGQEEKATLVVATVEGDIHDIGKNLVVLMLKNYGYRVIDLGKDVPAERIVETAMREKAKIIGLSALMTTTMMRMKEVVDLVREKGCDSKVVIGGAAITESFAEEIGADGYSKDAADCVKLVGRLLSTEK